MINNDKISLIDFSNKNIGRLIGKSKIEYTWFIKINENNFFIKWHHSVYSKKFRIYINEKLKIKETVTNDNKLFERKLTILDNDFFFTQTFDNFDLIYNNSSILNYKVKKQTIKTNNINNKKTNKKTKQNKKINIFKLNRNYKKFEIKKEFLTEDYKNYAIILENNNKNYDYLY